MSKYLDLASKLIELSKDKKQKVRNEEYPPFQAISEACIARAYLDIAEVIMDIENKYNESIEKSRFENLGIYHD